jgi:hypothetical protein
MKSTAQRITAAVAILIAFGLIAARLSAFDLDFWHVPDLAQQLEQEAQLDKDLDLQSESIARRLAAKEAIVEELASGRLDLVHAAAQVGDLNGARPDFVSLLRSHYPNLTDEECILRNTIEFAQARIGDRVDGPEVIARLERELRDFQRSRARH